MGDALNVAKSIENLPAKSAKPGEFVDVRLTTNALRNPPRLQGSNCRMSR